MKKSLKSYLLRIYNFPLLNIEETSKNQKRIRDVEWSAIEPFLKKEVFLDIGCGAGYSMLKAQENGCLVFGIDPNPGAHGVGRNNSEFFFDVFIKQAVAEQIPFEDKMFDTVYSSHALEHVRSEDESLMEMKRVLKDDGVLIIGMPTAHMAAIHLFSSTILNPHHRLVNFFLAPFIKTGRTTFKELFIPRSHSYENKSIFFDLRKYRISSWKQLLEKYFEVIGIIKPGLYPFPEMVQWFKLRKNHKFTSSVFFICKKK